MKTSFRKYGSVPFRIVLLHGGPGAAGQLAPVAKELSSDFSVIEHFQTADTIAGQVEELREVITGTCKLPVVLIGHSWGAWLACIFASQFPALVKKLILVSAGAFKESYNKKLMETRLKRLNKRNREKAEYLLVRLNNPRAKNISSMDFSRFGRLMEKADIFSPEPNKAPPVNIDAELFRNVWGEAVMLRASGELLNCCRELTCPVAAIHGDYDAHPYSGVREPLREVISNFKFHLLKNCGHYPWREKQAKDEFHRILKKEIKNSFL